MKKVFMFIIVCSIANVIYAQQTDTTIVFNKVMHDFGTFVKSDGVQTHTFEFTNTGDQPVTIQNVTSSCGCTTPDWTKEPVVPGKKGSVTVSYHPSGVTTFRKAVTVYIAGGNPKTVTLHISGNVTDSSENQ
jgi:hypothetical protein